MKNKLQQSFLNYLLGQQGKTTLKSTDHSPLLNHAILPSTVNNSLNRIQSPVLNYVLSDESKPTLKDNLQSSLLNYLLQQDSGRGLSIQESSLPETVSYLPVSNTLPERPKLSLPTSIPITTLSAVSRPVQSINYVPTTMPRMSTYMTHDSSPSTTLPLGMAHLCEPIKFRRYRSKLFADTGGILSREKFHLLSALISRRSPADRVRPAFGLSGSLRLDPRRVVIIFEIPSGVSNPDGSPVDRE